MEEKMFCFQCEQRMNEKACTVSGVCGKTPEIASLQDLIIYQLKGIASYANVILGNGGEVGDYIVKEIEDSLFMTLTNVNFNFDDHIYRLKRLQEIKEMLKNEGAKCDKEECTYTLSRTNEEILKDAKEKACILCDGEENVDIRSLKETIKYGLKGVAAYGHQARALGYKSEIVDKFYIEALNYISDRNISQGELLELLIKTGEVSVEVMRLLDECNTNIYSHPEVTEVSRSVKKGPFIIVSGHDLKDLEELLKQTEGKGINIYTHGEMLPANSYPQLKKYKHLVGNFGTAWQNQRKEFDGIPGCILMTTNCIMKPLESYKDRIFTTSVVGHEDLINIKDNMSGMKDFTPIINKALEIGGFTEEKEEKKIIIGFGRDATLKNAGKIVEMVKEGKIKH
ncbi:MAG: hydroxylamine reductase, partial [Clostridium sp.]